MQRLEASDPRSVGSYLIIALLGAGGMGKVYLGRSPGGRRVAVKVVKSEIASDPTFRARFRREVASAKAVSGFYTAPVIDADPDAPLPWLATAFIEGHDLRSAVVTAGPLPVLAVRSLAGGLAEALAAIHGVGLVHRDLKPSNVLLAADGPRVIDFGIAYTLDETSLTGEDVIGSASYMSPEQLTQGRMGPPSDVFSLGSTLTFATTGGSPFGSGSVATRLARIANGEIDVSGVPAELRPLITRCLARLPSERPTPAEILAELAADGEHLPGKDWLPEEHLTTERPIYVPFSGPPAPSTSGPPYHVTSGPPAPSTSGPPYHVTSGPPAPSTSGPPYHVTSGPPAPATSGPPYHVTSGPPAPSTSGPPYHVTSGPPAPSTSGPPYHVTSGPPAPSTSGPPYHVSPGPPGLVTPAPTQVSSAGPEFGSRAGVADPPGSGGVEAGPFDPAAPSGAPETPPWVTPLPGTLTPPTSPWTGTDPSASQGRTHAGGYQQPAVSHTGTQFPPHDYSYPPQPPPTQPLVAPPPQAGRTAPPRRRTRRSRARFLLVAAGLALIVAATAVIILRPWQYGQDSADGGGGARNPTLAGHTEGVRSVAFSPNGQLVATGAADNTARLWNVEYRQQVGEPLAGHTRWVNAVAFSPDGKLLATASWDRTVRLWDVASGQQRGQPMIGHTGPVLGVAFSLDGKLLATSGADNTARLWSVPSQKPLGSPFIGHTGWVNSVAFSPDGKVLATAGRDNTIRLWSVADHRPLAAPVTGHTKAVNSVEFSPDGKRLATASVDGTVRLWISATGTQLGAVLTGHNGGVNDATFSPDGKTLASAGTDGTARLWDTATRQPLGPPLTGHPKPVTSVAFSPDGRTLITGSFDDTARLWDVGNYGR